MDVDHDMQIDPPGVFENVDVRSSSFVCFYILVIAIRFNIMHFQPLRIDNMLSKSP